MESGTASDEKAGTIFLLCLFYAFHMAEEFPFGFVEWADRYFGRFDWTQNLFGNSMFLAVLALACFLYTKDSKRYLWVGIAGAMWILANAFLHISATVLGREYSPGVVTATALYLPGGIWFLVRWARRGVLTGKNLSLSFAVGGLAFMLVPTFARAVHYQAELARVFGLVR